MIFYNEYGDKKSPTVLLLHGAAALDTFSKQYSLSKDYHLIVPHLHGAGVSADKVYNPVDLVNELLMLIDFLNKEKIGVIGHSIGAQIALMLLHAQPDKFCFSVILSAWITPNPKAIKKYTCFSNMTSKLLKCEWLVRLQGKYWGYTEEQIIYLTQYSKKVTSEVYSSFFENTLNIADLKNYHNLQVPILAICGDKETKDIKYALNIMSSNTYCQTMVLKNGNHHFPMKKYKELNPILIEFIIAMSKTLKN